MDAVLSLIDGTALADTEGLERNERLDPTQQLLSCLGATLGPVGFDVWVSVIERAAALHTTQVLRGRYLPW
jgi:hypothetical protein